MIGTLDIKVNAAHPNMPLSSVYTFLGSPQQVRVINVPKQIGNWKLTAVQVTVNYPDNSSPSVEATLVGGCWSATLPAPSAVGQSLMGFKVTASGTDEHGDAITGYVLGKGDAYVLDDDATITVGGTTYYVHMLDAVPESPRKGDLAVIDNIYQLYDGSRWHPLGNQAQITWAEISGKPTAFPPEEHTHTKSEITDFPTSMPPTAHSHASDNWFTTAINIKADEVKPSFSTITINGIDYTEWTLGTKSGKIMLSVSMGGISTEIAAFNPVTGVFVSAPSQYRNTLRFDGKAPVVGSSPTLFDHVARESTLSGKANVSDFSPTNPADYVTDFVQQSAILQERIKSVAQSLIRTAVADFDPDEQSFADLVNILKNIGA